jgi:hypothetical protein
MICIGWSFAQPAEVNVKSEHDPKQPTKTTQMLTDWSWA